MKPQKSAIVFGAGVVGVVGVVALVAWRIFDDHFEAPAPLDPRVAVFADNPRPPPREQTGALVAAIADVDRGALLTALRRGAYIVDRHNAIAWDETYPEADLHRFRGLDDDVIQALRRRFADRRHKGISFPSESARVIEAADVVAAERRLPDVR